MTDGLQPPRGPISSVVQRTIAQVSVTASTAETVLVATTIPALSIIAGDTYRIRAHGNFDQSAAGGTMAFRIRYGGVAGTYITGAAMNATIPASLSAGRQWQFEADVVFRSTILATFAGRLHVNLTSAFTTSLNNATTTAVDTTTAKDLVLTVQLPTVNEAIRLEAATIQKL